MERKIRLSDWALLGTLSRLSVIGPHVQGFIIGQRQYEDTLQKLMAATGRTAKQLQDYVMTVPFSMEDVLIYFLKNGKLPGMKKKIKINDP